MIAIGLFADGDKEIGMGHLTRMRSVVQRLNAHAVLFTRTPDIAAKVYGEGQASNTDIVPIAEPDEILEQPTFKDGHIRLMLLDPPIIRTDPSAASGPAWQAFTARLQQRQCRTVRFTDEQRPSAHNCDMLVNDHPDADTDANVAAYRSENPTMDLCAGLRYFMIDREHETITPAPHNSVFISFGGGDQSGLVEHFRHAIDRIADLAPVHLVTGPATAAAHQDNGNISVHHNLAPAAFAALLAGAKLAVTAGGNTMFERVFHQRPGVSVAQFEHQQSFGLAFEKRNLTKHLGLGTQVTPENLAASVEHLWEDGLAREKQISAARTQQIQSGCRKIVNKLQAFLEA